jgi:hypothetical protein
VIEIPRRAADFLNSQELGSCRDGAAQLIDPVLVATSSTTEQPNSPTSNVMNPGAPTVASTSPRSPSPPGRALGVEVAAALGELPELLGDVAGEHRAACSEPGRVEVAAIAAERMTPTVRAPGQRRRRRDRRRAGDHRAGRVEVDGELQLGIEVVGAGHRHRPQRSPSSAWATSSTIAAVARRDREHRARRAPHGCSAGCERTACAALEAWTGCPLPPPLGQLAPPCAAGRVRISLAAGAPRSRRRARRHPCRLLVQ